MYEKELMLMFKQIRKWAIVLLTNMVLVTTVWAIDSTIRIVSVDGNATEILAALDMSSHIVAADVTSQSLINHSELLNLGYHRTLSSEGVLATRPDLIIGSDHMGPDKVITIIEQANIELIRLKSPSNLEQLINNVRKVASRLEQDDKATQLIEHIMLKAQHIQQNGNSQPTKMLFLLDMGGKGLSQAGSGTTADALISLLGGDNVSEFTSYKPVSVEAILAQQPDVILIGQRSETPIDTDTLLSHYPLLKGTKAAHNNAVISVNAAHLIAGISLGALDEAERLSEQLNSRQ
jgi:iron complex transport system substrate-binding protein